MAQSFLWHDYETFGANPRRDRPAQFAALRTDASLAVVGDPIMLYCRPADDVLPDPRSCLITGITPQVCLHKGVPETEFARHIEQALAWPGTVGVGYNSIRFDDEVTRFMFWRNLIDPYAREWQNECGRWDLLDVVRTAYALRPAGIEWPQSAEGRVSFKLADLAAANGIAHDAAHDALSDVRATLELARLVRSSQPRLFEFCLGLHRKDRVAQELGLPTSQANARPFLHVSGRFSPERGCLALMWPLAMHPINRNELLAWDLQFDPRELADLNAEQIRLRLFTPSADLSEGVSRLPIKSVHLNKSPMVFSNQKVLDAGQAERWQFDLSLQLRHAATARDLPDMSAIWAEVYRQPQAGAALDVDEDLYGGFVGDADRRRLNELRSFGAEALAQARPRFHDPRLGELFWRYRARNFGQSLTPAEQQAWQAHRAARLLDGAGGHRTVEALLAEIDLLAESASDRDQAILGDLYDYADAIAPERQMRTAPGGQR